MSRTFKVGDWVKLHHVDNPEWEGLTGVVTKIVPTPYDPLGLHVQHSGGLGPCLANAFGAGHIRKIRVPKANDNIPADEMVLAEALAEAHARGLKWTSGTPFDTGTKIPENPRECCAIGAIALRDGKVGQDAYQVAKRTLEAAGLPDVKCYVVYRGNDRDDDEDDSPGMTLGRAFRHAMT
jgi:hypothetical protein